MKDPFEFFREHLPESQKVKISIEEERRDTRSRTEYPFFTFAPLITQLIVAILTIYVWLGVYSGLQSPIFALSYLLDNYSGVLLVLATLALICGFFGLFFSNKKKYPLAAVALCLLVTTPLTAMYLINTRVPHITQDQAVAIAYQNVPTSVSEKVPLSVRWVPQIGTAGAWQMEFDNVNITPAALGWVANPSGTPEVRLDSLNPSTGIVSPSPTFQMLLIEVDGGSGDVLLKMASQALIRTYSIPPPITVLPPKQSQPQ